MGLHGGVAHHQAAQDGHGGPNGPGEPQPRLLEDLKGKEEDEHLKHGGKGHLLLGGHNGQGQLDGDGLGMEGDQGDIQPGHQKSRQSAQPPDEIQGGGRHPVEGPVLAGLEKLVDGAGQHPGKGHAVGQQPHPAFQQPLAEAVGALGKGHSGKGGV